MPDANKEHTINQLVGAAFGAAGQRCMALSAAVFVGKTKEWIPQIVEKANQLKVGYNCLVSMIFCILFVFRSMQVINLELTLVPLYHLKPRNALPI